MEIIKYKRLTETDMCKVEKTCYGHLKAQTKLKFETTCVFCLSRRECGRAGT